MAFWCIILICISILLLIIRDRFVQRNKKIFTRGNWLYLTGTIEFWLEIIKLKIIVAFSQLGFLIIKPIVYSMSRKRTKKGLPMTDPRIVRISNFGKNLMIKEYKASNLLKRYGK